MADLPVMSPAVCRSGRSGTPGSFLLTTRCGLRVGMEVGGGMAVLLWCHRLSARVADRERLGRF